MQTLTITIPENVEARTVKAVLKALGVSVSGKKRKEAKEEKPYNPEFVAMIEKSRQEAREGKSVKIALEDLWK